MITIFTPIYNRAYMLDNLYQSLLRQTNSDFEWLIVDDGSTDNIFALVCSWIRSTNKFKIRFYQQINSGKHCAINYGLDMANGDAFFIVDSDDYLEDDAIECIFKYWKLIENKKGIAGISGLRRKQNGEVIGDVPKFVDFIDATNLEREKFGLNGDKAEVYKTEILRKFPFPVFKNETFVTEAVVWDKIAYEGYKLRWINRSFIVCEYLQDGLTAKGEKLFVDNPKGWACYIRDEKKYGRIKKEEYLKTCYYYYEKENKKFTWDEVKTMLNLEDIEGNIVINQYINFTQNLIDICANKKVCIYTYGQWGKRLKDYLDKLGIYVEYIIDKQFSKIEKIKAYSIEMELPQVDIVFIALSGDLGNMENEIQRKIPQSRVFLLKDIKPDLW